MSVAMEAALYNASQNLPLRVLFSIQAMLLSLVRIGKDATLRRCSNPLKSNYSTSSKNGLSDHTKLEGKVSVITGGASGIGASTARLFVSKGAKVIIADVQDEPGRNLCNELGHQNTHFVHCDVRREEDVAATVKTAISRFQALDIMFNCAGIVDKSGASSITELDASTLEQVFSVNINGTLFGVKHAARAMISMGRQHSSILNMSSMASVVALKGFHAYTISKHAVVGITKSAASELCQHGIRVNCISPSLVLTPLAMSYYQALHPSLTPQELGETVAARSELKGVVLKDHDVARAALFLSCNDGRYITGHNLVVDGGFSISRPFNPFEST